MTHPRPALIGALLAVPALTLAGCGQADDSGSGAQDAFTIGITQIVEHPSLDSARDGFKQAFEDAGYIDGETVVFDEQSAQGDQNNATTIANNFADAQVDLVLAIATPAAQAAAGAISDIPITITAVTEPVEAGLADSWEAPGGNITGTSDLTPVAEQLELLTQIAPEASTVGVLYSSGEVNSQVQVDIAKEEAANLGLEIQEQTVTNSSEVSQAANALSGVDAIYVPTDNNVVSSLESVIQVAESSQVPLIVGEADSVERGGLATYGIDYTTLGVQTGEMAIDILENGTDPAEMPIQTIDQSQLVLNQQAAERMGVELPEELVDSADTVIE